MTVLGSHNSWSYLPVRKWWMKPLAFMARCQAVDIKTQYELGVRCFDLRLFFDKDHICTGDGEQVMYVAHGIFRYEITSDELEDHLRWLNEKGDCYVRVLHEVRTKSQYTKMTSIAFRMMCSFYRDKYTNIRFWNGRNLYNEEKDYDFGDDPSNDGKYASVCSPRLIDDWWPWLYARLHNRKIRKEGTDKEILLIDYVDIV